MGKLGSALACLLFAVPFGGVGVFATWAIGSTLHDAWRARQWMPVQASVVAASLHASSGSEGGDTYRAEATYRYAYGGRSHSGSRLGFSAVGGSDNIDDWHQEVNARLESARASGQPVTVWVNPDNPSESVYDRGIRWGELLFLTPFSLAFGGVGVGALVVMVHVLKGQATGSGNGTQQALDKAFGTVAKGGRSQGEATPRFLWVFAFFWNAMSWPIAILVMRDIASTGEWMGLLVLLFPLVGLGLLWGAVATTWQAWAGKRRGAGQAQVPQAGQKLARTAPATMSAQAAHAMFDPPGPDEERPMAGFPAGGRLEMPASVAQVEEHGGALTIRYNARRRLGLAVALALMGLFVAGFGVVFFGAGDSLVFAVVMVAIGALLDIGAAALLADRLEVSAKPGELAVERTGLTGRKSWRIRRDSIKAIRPVQSYAINGVPYYTIRADLGGEHVPLGNSIRGEALALDVARRIAGAVGLDASRVSRVESFGENAQGSGA